jgi:hypothetical protein
MIDVQITSRDDDPGWKILEALPEKKPTKNIMITILIRSPTQRIITRSLLKVFFK